MRLRDAKTLWALLALTTAACNDTTIDEVALAPGDEETFATDVQEYVGYRCASLDCHGDMGRTLRLYAERGLRLETALRDRPITSAELRNNILAMAAFGYATEPVEENLILLKPLVTSAGGMAHKGGDVWATTSDPGYRCLAAWLANRSSETVAQQACDEATANVVPEE